MNNSTPPTCSRPLPQSPGVQLALAGLCGLGILAAAPVALAQSDDFNDGNDTGWERYDPIGSVLGPQATWSFPGGNTYRLQTAISPLPGTVGPGRAASLRPEIYTDFYVSMDLVNWNNSLDQAIGLLARVNDAGLGTTDGYGFTYQVLDKDVDITRIVNEAGPAVPLSPTSGAITLVPGKSYRFEFFGRGTTLTGRIYELPNITTPIIEVTGTDSVPDPADSLHISGKSGVIVFDNSSGRMVTDATWDNYFATDVEPPRIRMEDQGFGDIRLLWPTSATGFKLQCSDTLPGSEWATIPDDFISMVGLDQFAYYTSSAAGNKFFRLQRP